MIKSEHWRKIKARLDARSLRERLLVFCALAATVLALADGLLFTPLAAQREGILRELAGNGGRILNMENQIEQLRQLRRQDPDLAIERQIRALEARLQTGEHPLSDVTRGLIDPAEMPGVLEAILGRNDRIRVLRLQNLPPVPLSGGGAETADDKSAEEGGEAAGGEDVLIYKHGIRLTVSGRYGDLVSLLRQLEQQSWRILWEGVELSSEGYPRSRLDLVIYTLSFEPNWMMV